MPRAGATLPEAGGLHPTIQDSIQVSQGRRHGAQPPGPGCAMHAARIGDEQSGVGIRGVGAGGRLMRRIGPARGWRAAEIAPGSSRIDPRGTGGRPRLSRWRARVGAPLLASHVPSPAGVGPLSRPGRHRARGPRALALPTGYARALRHRWDALPIDAGIATGEPARNALLTGPRPFLWRLRCRAAIA